MRLLLDTHAFLFAINPFERLPPKVLGFLEDPTVERWVSAISLWEIAIKVRIGKLPLPSEPAFYTRHLASLGAHLLPVDAAHSFTLFALPLHHRDPFDRLLIAQAITEGLTIATIDPAFAAYDVPTVW
jgi:PIN domain nuclease of toxin-antitoxin system